MVFEGKTKILVQTKNKIVLVLIQHAHVSGYFIPNKFICQKNILKYYFHFKLNFYSN